MTRPLPAGAERLAPSPTGRSATDPLILLVHPPSEPSTELVLTVSEPLREGLLELFGSRDLRAEPLAGEAGGGLVHLRVRLGGDRHAVADLADCLEIELQLLGQVVFGPLAGPSLVDVDRSGRDSVTGVVEATMAQLRPQLPA